MSGPVRPPLTVAESDGTPTVRPVNTISLNSADFTLVDQGGGTVRIDVNPGGGTSLTDTFVGFGDSSNLLTGSASLTFDDTNKKLTITGDADDDSVVEIIGSDSASGAGPRLTITNDSGTDSALDLTMDNFAVGILRGGTPGGTMREVMRFGQMSSDNYTVTFNEGGLGADFRIEGDSKQNLFFVDGGNNRVGVGDEPTVGIFQIQNGNFYVGPASASGSSAQTPSYHKGGTALKNYLASNTSSGDQVAGIRVFSDNFRSRGMMIGKMDDVTVDDTVTEQYLFGTQYSKSNTAGISAAPENGGTEYITVTGLGVAGSSSVIINEDGIDMDFRVETNNNIRTIEVSGQNDNVGIGGEPASSVERLHVKGTGTDTLVRLESTDAGATQAPDLELFRNSPSPASADYTGSIIFSGYEDTAASSKVDYARIDTRMFGLDSTENGVLTLYTRQNNALRPQISMKSTGVIINENQESFCDFAVETTGSTTTLFVDSGNDNVGIGTVADSGVQLEVKNSISPGSASIVRISNSNTSMPNETKFGAIEFYNADASGAGVGAEIRALSNGSGRGGQLDFLVGASGGSQTSKMFIDESGIVTIASTASSNTVAPTQSPPLMMPNQSGAASYAYIIPSTTSPMTLTNNDLQSPLLVHDSASALTINLPLDGGEKGQYFRFVSTNGNITIVPSATAGDTINGSASSVTRSTDNQIYECVCIAANTWIVSNP